MDFYVGDGLSAPPDHGGVRQTLPALPRGDQFGYRTRRSMASQEAWNFAHHACGKLWFRWGLVLLPVTVGLMLLVWGRDTGTVGLFGAVVMVVQLAVLLLSVAVVENALKRTFGEER